MFFLCHGNRGLCLLTMCIQMGVNMGKHEESIKSSVIGTALLLRRDTKAKATYKQFNWGPGLQFQRGNS